MTFKEIQELIKLVNRMNLTEFKLKDGNFELSIRTKDYLKTKSISYDSPPVISVAQPAQAAPQVAAAVPDLKPQVAEAAPAAPSAGDDSKLVKVKSPIVGTFYRSSSPDKPAFVSPGDKIKVGDVVCIVEAMKLFNEIESEVSGTIVEVLVDDASPIEYDQPLFLVQL